MVTQIGKLWKIKLSCFPCSGPTDIGLSENYLQSGKNVVVRCKSKLMYLPFCARQDRTIFQAILKLLTRPLNCCFVWGAEGNVKQ